jgi:polyhydroxyalkanoate synthesis regulator phasin
MAKQSKGAAAASKGTAEEGGSRGEQSVQAFRDALDKSVTISRDLLQEVVDDAVRRGRMTRGDAEELVSRLVSRGREQAEDILGQLEKLLDEAGTRAKQARKAVSPSKPKKKSKKK